ncbi:reverse transcriptase domain-containing protein [Tanacetum coccineum]|uniref:Reverse transcriptase domain-containing protein n=1 Tax=Tanacetum coccineum TaxID=301880 RepID=A0ABQ4WEQ0_9ASTR
MMVSIPMTFSSANSTEYLVSTVDGTVLLKGLILMGVRLLSTRFHVLAIIASIALTSGSLEDISSSKRLKTQVFYTLQKKKIEEHNTKSKNQAKYAALLRKRVPFEQRNEPRAQPKVVYAPVLDINHFCHFLDILENYNPMDDEPMWDADRVVALTPGSAITIPETANEFAIKGNHFTLVKGKQFDGNIFADKQSGRPYGSLPSNTQPNPKGSSSKPYQPPQARNEHVNAVFTQSGKSYDPPINPNDQPNDFEIPINFDSKDEDEEPTPQPKPKDPKPVKETLIPKPYKPKILYPQRLIKEKMEAQCGKLLDMIRAVRINVPLIDVLAGMPNYGKFLKELVSNKHKLKQISAAFLSNESTALIQNKVPPKLGDPESFLIPCNFNKAFSCDVLADLGASINLMPYSLYDKLSLETLKPTKMNVRLANRSFQYPVGIAENMLIEVGKFTFLVDFVILEMEEAIKVPLILGRSFLHTADAVIRLKQKQLNLGVGTECMPFHMDSAMKYSYSNDDTCFSIDVIDEILEQYFDALLDEEPHTDLELKPLPDNSEYVFLEEPSFLPIIVSSQLSEDNKNKLISVLKNHKKAFAWKTTDNLATFQRCMLAIFHDMIEESVEVFMDDFSVFGNSFDNRLKNSIKCFNVAKMQILSLTGKNVALCLKKELCLDTKCLIENDETSDDIDVDDNFPRETLMEITTNDTPWFADFANYLVGDVIPKGMTYQQKKKIIL